MPILIFVLFMYAYPKAAHDLTHDVTNILYWPAIILFWLYALAKISDEIAEHNKNKISLEKEVEFKKTID